MDAIDAPSEHNVSAHPKCTPLHDMHCHLDFMTNGEAIARDAAGNGTLFFANTVTPSGYLAARERFFALENVRLGIGMHPWYVDVSKLSDQLQLLDEQLPTTRYVGEIGLDFSKRKANTADAQLIAFERIAGFCGREGNRLLSIHAVKSADKVLDILKETGALDSCACIFHWFSGSAEQLHRAIKAGCYFSVGPFMAESKRGREYLKVIPTGQLLMETDAPPTLGENATVDDATGEPRTPYSYSQLAEWLARSASVVSRIKGNDVFERIDYNARMLLEVDT